MAERAELTCRDFIDVIMAWLDGELEPATRKRFDEHLTACVDCAHYLRSYQMTVALGKSVCGPRDPSGPVREDVPEELVQAVLATRKRR